MAFTVKNVVDEVRPLVSDSDVPYRWTDAQMKAKVNEGLQEVFTLRPDAVATISPNPPEDISNLYDDVPVRPVFKTALIYYTASSLLMERGSDKSLRTQGQDYQKLFFTLMGI
jgi:hypothetical protein